MKCRLIIKIKKSLKRFQNKILKNSQRPLLIVFAVFVFSLSIINASLDDLDSVYFNHSFFNCSGSSCLSEYTDSVNSDKHPALVFVDIMDIIGRNTIIIYQLHGIIAYEGVKSVYEWGNNVIRVYEFMGEIAYVGIKETVKSYKEMFGFSSSTNDYMNNVVEGRGIVVDILKKNFKI